MVGDVLWETLVWYRDHLERAEAANYEVGSPKVAAARYAVRTYAKNRNAYDLSRWCARVVERAIESDPPDTNLDTHAEVASEIMRFIERFGLA